MDSEGLNEEDRDHMESIIEEDELEYAKAASLINVDQKYFTAPENSNNLQVNDSIEPVVAAPRTG